MDNEKVKKQLVVNKDLYRRLKAKLILEDVTLMEWLERVMRQEVENGQQQA